jgi:hypothetical protein
VSAQAERKPLYNATRGLASTWLLWLCPTHLKARRADGWKVRKSGMFTREGMPMSECRDCEPSATPEARRAGT